MKYCSEAEKMHNEANDERMCRWLSVQRMMP